MSASATANPRTTPRTKPPPEPHPPNSTIAPLLAVPINPDLASVGAAVRPECLSALASDEEADQAVSERFDAVLGQLTDSASEEILLFASTPLYQSPKRWLEFDLVAGWTGLAATDATEDVVALLSPLFTPGEHVPLTLPVRIPSFAADDCAAWLMERGCLPAALQPAPDAWARWQTGMFVRDVSFPMPFGLGAPIEIDRRTNCLIFETADPHVERWVWSHCGWSPGFPAEAKSSIGTALFVRKELTDRWSSAMRERPRRLARLRRFWRSEEYGDYMGDAAVTAWLE